MSRQLFPKANLANPRFFNLFLLCYNLACDSENKKT